MSILPPRTQDLLNFFEVHAPAWSTSAVSIGLTTEQATAFANAASAAQAAYLAKLNADAAAKAATLTLRTAMGAGRASAAEMIRLIKAFAESQAKPDVIYTLAKIPAPAPRTPMPPPGQPTDLRAVLNPTTGGIELRWKSANPRGAYGTSYIIRRRNAGEAAFVFVGTTGGGSKRFVDASFSAGHESVEYTVQGQRGDLTGPVSTILTINFGRVAHAGAGTSATLTTTPAGPNEVARLAA